MSSLNVLVVIGTTSRKASTRVVGSCVAEQLRAVGCAVDVFDYEQTPLPLFNPDTSWSAPDFAVLKARVELADALVLISPDYHGSMSSALKNFLDHFWKEYAGKLFASVVGSFDKGLTVHDQIRTVARQCYAWALPYGVTFTDKEDVRDGVVASDALRQRVEMLTRDVRVYGALLAEQRRADLAGTEPGFLARQRK
ncbi:MAG: NAD(P)H-dependent oxidoreductase [Verrucomicrobia bacterium]|nr:NAD(P)H-dependent oxidoreductase [Verrucomicrobiota bacterium]